MAFHVACPITCRRICYCDLGFPGGLHGEKSKAEFVEYVSKIEEFFKDPWGIAASFAALRDGTVQVVVPKVSPPPPPAALVPVPVPPPPIVPDGGCSRSDEDDVAAAAAARATAVAAQNKRNVLQKKADADVVAAEDYARRFESGNVEVASNEISGEEEGLSNTYVMCRMCFVGEREGSERAKKMHSCTSCGKKYHKSCVKSWSQHRDLFHWSSWNCPSCRICEICRKTGDPNKFMFCKRCDGAYHCYCQHPPHKNVSSGPYLCPKHTRCHSCGSKVPGNGLSVRWFLGYTCCDACGRLFVKGNYCPVCLKVYRDSESTPMVCCDICQRWVHCQCDGISDERYLQFQVDRNLQYSCATCRGECYQVTDLEDAVQELWRRRDTADRDLIASLRAAAGLPIQESQYSDDEEKGPFKPQTEHGRSLKLSFKSLVDSSPKKNKEYGKKVSNKKSAKKKGSHISFVSKTEPLQHLSQRERLDNSKNGVESLGERLDGHPPRVPGAAADSEEMRSINQSAISKHKSVDELMVNDGDRTSRVFRIKSNKTNELDSGDDSEKHATKSESVKAKKLVINLGARKINISNSPRSDASSCQKEQDKKTSNGDMADRSQVNILKYARREGSFIKLGKPKSEAATSDPAIKKDSSVEGSRTAVGTSGEVPVLRSDSVRNDTHTASNEKSGAVPTSQHLTKDSKISLKLKIKKPNPENQNHAIPFLEEEKSAIRGQRSKRKRPSTFVDKIPFAQDEDVEGSPMDSEMMEASWILQKLGKDAIGKRVEVHQPSDNTWHRGTVSNIIEGTCTVSVTLDDRRVKTLELGKQAVRFVPQKQKRSTRG